VPDRGSSVIFLGGFLLAEKRFQFLFEFDDFIGEGEPPVYAYRGRPRPPSHLRKESLKLNKKLIAGVQGDPLPPLARFTRVRGASPPTKFVKFK
jgi:hypothetical protein